MSMCTTTPLAQIAALLGDPARANMLEALMEGRALTAKELALVAHVAPATASGHLARLTEGGLLCVLPRGRHRYYRLAGPKVAAMIESVMDVAADRVPRRPRAPSRREAALRRARTCYDHIAGRLGVAIADSLAERDFLRLDDDAAELTAAGAGFLAERLGIDSGRLGARRRILCRPCLDWTERRPHLAGAVGAAIAGRCFDLGWLLRQPGSRALAITASGSASLRETFGFAG
jgi:DNA-binding transcriptional ArsR family regulator